MKQKYNEGVCQRGAFAAKAMLYIALAFFIAMFLPGKMATVKAGNTTYVVGASSTINGDAFPDSAIYKEVLIRNGVTFTVNGNVQTDIPVKVEKNGTLIINGNFTTAGDFSMDSDTSLTIVGSYIQKKGAFNPYGTGASIVVGGSVSFVEEGNISSIGTSVRADVDGDFIYDSAKDCSYNNVLWNIKGNVLQGEEKGALKFKTLHLVGNAKQTLSLNENCEITELYQENGSELEVLSYLHANLYTDADITTGENALFSGITVKEGKNVTVTGGMVSVGDFQMEKNVVLTVNGDYTQKKGSFNPRGIGDVVSFKGNASFVEAGYIASSNTEALISVDGNFLYDTARDCSSNSPVWNIKGNVSQGEMTGRLQFKELHLTRNSKQIFSVNEGCDVEELYLENSDEMEVPAYFSAVICTDADIATGENTLFNNTTITEGRNVTVAGHMTATGNIRLEKNAVLTVSGNYVQKSGYFSPSGTDAVINIRGDFSAADEGYISSAVESVVVNLDGSFSYNSVKDCYNNSATWKIGGNITQGERQGRLSFRLVELLSTGAVVSINSRGINTLVLGCALSNFSISSQCYENIRAKVKVTLDPTGGLLADRSMLITTGDRYERLPVPTSARAGFIGWYTQKEGGELVDGSTVSTQVEDHTLYAHWTNSPVTVDAENPEAAKPVAGVEVDKKDLELIAGETYQLTATILPADATEKQVSWTSSNAAVVTVSETGLVTALKDGSAYVTVTTKDGAKTDICIIRVSKAVTAPNNIKLSSVKNDKPKAAVIKWKKASGAGGYEVQYALNKKFTRSQKSKDIKSADKKTATIKKLKKDKTYYFRVRAYALNARGEKVYGKWSGTKKVKILD